MGEKAAATVTVTSPGLTPEDEAEFFPFESDAERQTMNLHITATFPWMGLIGIVGSLTMVVVSAVILLVVDKKALDNWADHVPKPAAILSAVLSATSILLHIALSEGSNIAWWYAASRSRSTLFDLHSLWTHGTSISSVVKDAAADVKNIVVNASRSFSNHDGVRPAPSRSRRFTYLALATLLVATIPANGILLQNAVTVVSVTRYANSTVSVPIDAAPAWKLGTARYNEAGVPTSLLMFFSQAVSLGVTPFAAAADLGRVDTLCLDACDATAPGLGFNISLTDTTPAPFQVKPPTDYPPSPAYLNQTWLRTGQVIFSCSVSFNEKTDPHRIFIDVMWKGQDATGCIGDLTVRKYALRYATVEYPVSIKANVSTPDASNGATNHTIIYLNPSLDLVTTELNVMREETPHISPMVGNGYTSASMLGGLAILLGTNFNSSVTLRYNVKEGNYEYDAVGGYAQQVLATHTQIGGDDPTCYGYFPGPKTPGVPSSLSSDLGRQTLAQVQRMVFMTAVYTKIINAPGEPGYLPWDSKNLVIGTNVTGAQTWAENQYHVTWRWYFGSLALTIAIVLCITPTFWGFWALERRTTMSPIDTARPLRAPAVQAASARVPAAALLKDVGSRHVHPDVEQPDSARE